MIQELEKSKIEVLDGFDKHIDPAAETLLLDVIQTYQYQKPLASTIRELTSNSKDAVEEARIAKLILTGKAKVEDYYINREGALYESSKWDPSYYDLNYLSNNQVVTVEYHHNYNESVQYPDALIFKDEGVGIGDNRVLGITSAGWSSKRNTRSMLGLYGAGSKVSLSLNNESFIIESSHNGRLIRLEIFDYKVVPLISAFNFETNQPNEYYEFRIKDKDIKIPYLRTEAKNYTKFIVPMQPSVDRVTNSIKEQLAYIKNVEYKIFKDGVETNVDFRPKIEYESKNLLITNKSRYSVVEVAIVKNDEDKQHDTIISYGAIDFAQMNMNNVKGSVAIKCPIRSTIRNSDGTEIVIQEGIDTVVSRESVRYTKNTIEFIKKRFEQATEEAKLIIEKEVNKHDIIEWVKACTSTFNYTSNGGYLSKLLDIVDRSQISTVYPKDNSIEYHPDIFTTFPGINIRLIRIRELSSNKYSVDRVRLTKWTDVYSQHHSYLLYLKDSNTSPYIDYHITKGLINKSFCYIEKMSIDAITAIVTESYKNEPNTDINQKVEEIVKQRDKIFSILQKSKELKNYDTIKLTDDDLALYRSKLSTESDKDGDTNTQLLRRKGELEEERKRNQQVLTYFADQYGTVSKDHNKLNIKVSDIIENKIIPKVYWGNEEDKDKLLVCAALLGNNVTNNITDKGKILLLRIRKDLNKYFEEDYSHIDEMYKDLKIPNKIPIQGVLIWQLLPDLNHYASFHLIDDDIYKVYDQLNTIVLKRASIYHSNLDIKIANAISRVVKSHGQEFILGEELNNKVLFLKAVGEITKDIFDILKEVGTYHPIHESVRRSPTVRKKIKQILNAELPALLKQFNITQDEY